MPILTTQFNDLVKNALVTWRESYNSVDENARQLYDIIDNPALNTEYSQLDPAGFARRKQQGGAYVEGSPIERYPMLLQKSRVGLKEEITWEMRKYDKYREIDKKMQTLGESTAMRIELDLTLMFNFGMTASSYTNMDGETVNTTTADGIQLFSTAHTITLNSNTISNYVGTTSFGRTGLESAERLFRNMTNNNAIKVVPKPDTIITSDDPAMINAVGEFLISTTAPDTADRADNVYHRKYAHIQLPYLAVTNLGAPTTTGQYYWMLADLAHRDAILEFSELPTFKMATPDSNGEEFDTDDWKAKSSASYAYGILDFKWIVGSAATTV